MKTLALGIGALLVMTLTAAAITQQVTFQEGLNGYSGTDDTYVRRHIGEALGDDHTLRNFGGREFFTVYNYRNESSSYVRSHGLLRFTEILGGIGGLLYWQVVTGRWASWSYAWALIPGFVGVGMIVAGLLESRGKRGELFRGGGTLLLISLILFAIFGSFLGGFFGLGKYWPLLLVVLGLFLLVQPFLFRKR